MRAKICQFLQICIRVRTIAMSGTVRVVHNDIGMMPTLNTLFLYISLNILPLSLQFQLKLGTMIYKILRSKSCPAIEQLFLSYIRTYDSDANVRPSIPPFNVPMLRLEGF